MKTYRYRVAGLVAGALLLGAIFVVAQTVTGGANEQSPTAPMPAPPRPQFFAGSVVELDAGHIKVTRTVVGRPTESRSFSINAATKMNKTVVKLHTRVTVRYKRLSEGDVALEIQPQPVITRTPKS